MVAAAINGRHKELGDLWKAQFAGGKGSFINVVILFFLIGAAGAITQLKPLAIAFMGLILLVMVLGSSGTTESTNALTRIRQQVGGA